MTEQKSKSSLFGLASPRLRLRRSFDGDGSAGKTMRSRLFSQNDSGFLTPVLETIGVTRFSSRGGLPKGLAGEIIATNCYSTVLLDKKNMVNMMRVSPPQTFNIFAEGAFNKSKKKKMQSYKFSKVNAILSDGKLTFRPSEAGSPNKAKRFDTTVHNICSLVLEKENQMISFQAWTPGKHAEYDQLMTYKLKLSSSKQAEHIAKKLLLECENYGIVLDLNIGFLQMKEGKSEATNHLETLLRKRYALFNITKREKSASLSFAREEMINYLEDQEETSSEAKLWRLKTGEGFTQLSVPAIAKDIQALKAERAINFSDFEDQLRESISSLLFSNSVTDREPSGSYYISQLNSGKLAESD